MVCHICFFYHDISQFWQCSAAGEMWFDYVFLYLDFDLSVVVEVTLVWCASVLARVDVIYLH